MRIIVLSDTHLTVPDPASESLFPRQIRAMGEEGVRLYETMRLEIARAFRTCCQWIREHGPWDLLVHTGDITGGWREQGSAHPIARALLKETVRELETCAKVVRFTPGNHDFGYKGTGTTVGELQSASVDAVGPVLWKIEEGPVLHLGVSGAIASYRGTDPALVRLRERQRRCVRGDLTNNPSRSWILWSHEPTTPRHLADIIRPHLPRLLGFVYGDLHAPGPGRLLRAAGYCPLFWPTPALSVNAYALRRSSMCPSTAPLWWKGYGLLEVEVRGKQMKTQVIRVPRPADSVDIPSSSIARSVWWMMRKRR